MQNCPTCGTMLSPTLMTPERVSTVVVAGCDGAPVPDLAWLPCKACNQIYERPLNRESSHCAHTRSFLKNWTPAFLHLFRAAVHDRQCSLLASRETCHAVLLRACAVSFKVKCSRQVTIPEPKRCAARLWARGLLQLLEEGTPLALAGQRRGVAAAVVAIVAAALKVPLPLGGQLVVGCLQRHRLQCSLSQDKALGDSNTSCWLTDRRPLPPGGQLATGRLKNPQPAFCRPLQWSVPPVIPGLQRQSALQADFSSSIVKIPGKLKS